MLHIHWHKTIAQNGYNGRRWLQQCRCGHRRVREVFNSNPRPVPHGLNEDAFLQTGAIEKAPPPPPPKNFGPPIRPPSGRTITGEDVAEFCAANLRRRNGEPIELTRWQCEFLAERWNQAMDGPKPGEMS